jgi:DNA-binding CsgD family transcriptional regulator
MRALRPRIKGVILMDSSRPGEVLECFRAGARGIFSKEEPLESLCKCIRSVHEGQVWARSVDLDHALEALAKTPLVRATNHKGIELLSEREREVIQHLAGGLSNREIASALGLSAHTIKNYLFRIFDKLGVSSRTELLYLTMHNSQVEGSTNVKGQDLTLSETIAAAEAGDATSQLLLAQHFSQLEDTDRLIKNGGTSEAEPDPVSAYMWYLVAERSAARAGEQIAAGKKNVARALTPQQLAEAERRAEECCKQSRRLSGSEGSQRDDPQEMHAGA